MSEIKLQKMYTFPQEVLWGFEVLHHIDIPQVIKKLTSLNMAKNPAPVNLFCSINRLTVEGLNALFGTLHANEAAK